MAALAKRIQKLLNFRGAMAAVLTPYDNKGQVDVSQIPGYVQYLVENNVDGVYIIGTTGEGYNLTNAERLSIAKAWRQAIDKQNANLLAVVNVTSNCIKEAVELTRQVESLGLDAIAVLPPNYYKPASVTDWVNYIKIFGDAAPETPILYYHIPFLIGEFNFDIVDAIEEGLKRVPQLSAMKFTDNNIVRLSLIQKKFKDNFKVLNGFDEQLLATLAATDCTAGICALFNFPSVVQSYKKIVKFVEQRDLESARKEQNKIIDETLVHKSKGNFFLSVKTAFNEEVRSRGLNFGLPRPPIHYHYKF